MRIGLIFALCTGALAWAACGGDTVTFGSGGNGASTSDGGSSGGSGAGGDNTSTAGNGPGSGGAGGFPNPCGSSTEVVGPPDDWEGPISVAIESDSEDLPVCVNDDAIRLGNGALTFDPAACGCECGDVNKASCSISVGFWPSFSTSCNGNPSQTQTLQNGVCSPTAGDVSGNNIEWSPTTPAPGACEPQAQAPVLPEPSWGEVAAGCSAITFSGGDGATCADPPQGWQNICIVRPGDHACPSGYPEKLTFYKGLADTRDCNDDCTCDESSVTCSGTVALHNTNNCIGGIFQGVGPNQCSFASATRLQYVATTTGSCTPMPATPNGTVTPDEPHTVCCVN